MGILGSLSAFVLWNKAVEKVGFSKVGIIYYTLPLFNGFLAYLFLKEDIRMILLYCAILIVSGIVTANYESIKSNQTLNSYAKDSGRYRSFNLTRR